MSEDIKKNLEIGEVQRILADMSESSDYQFSTSERAALLVAIASLASWDKLAVRMHHSAVFYYGTEFGRAMEQAEDYVKALTNDVQKTGEKKENNTHE